MRRRMTLQVLALVSLAVWLPALTKTAVAQEAKGEKVFKETENQEEHKTSAMYRLEYTVRELEMTKPLFVRSAYVLLHTGQKGKLRMGMQAPYTTERHDVGINLDCSLIERANDWLLDTNFESFGAAPFGKMEGTAGTLAYGLVRSSIELSVAPGRPTVVATIDNASRNRRYEIEVTVTKVTR